MILGFICFIIAAIFVVNIAFACGKCEQRENGWFNLIFGFILLFVILAGMVKEWLGPTSAAYPTPVLWWAAQVTLFAMTYVFLGLQRIKDFDGRAVGWWCLFVLINIPLPAYQTYLTGDIPLVLIWIWWGWLWALFWYSLALQRGTSKLFGRVTVASMVIAFFFTLWIPSLYMLNGWW